MVGISNPLLAVFCPLMGAVCVGGGDGRGQAGTRRQHILRLGESEAQLRLCVRVIFTGCERCVDGRPIPARQVSRFVSPWGMEMDPEDIGAFSEPWLSQESGYGPKGR